MKNPPRERYKCANVRIQKGHVVGDCKREAIWECPQCKALRCPSHAPSGYCGACGSECGKIQ